MALASQLFTSWFCEVCQKEIGVEEARFFSFFSVRCVECDKEAKEKKAFEWMQLLEMRIPIIQGKIHDLVRQSVFRPGQVEQHLDEIQAELFMLKDFICSNFPSNSVASFISHEDDSS
jgi:hypothetical protein